MSQLRLHVMPLPNFTQLGAVVETQRESYQKLRFLTQALSSTHPLSCFSSLPWQPYRVYTISSFTDEKSKALRHYMIYPEVTSCRGRIGMGCSLLPQCHAVWESALGRVSGRCLACGVALCQPCQHGRFQKARQC